MKSLCNLLLLCLVLVAMVEGRVGLVDSTNNGGYLIIEDSTNSPMTYKLTWGINYTSYATSSLENRMICIIQDGGATPTEGTTTKGFMLINR